MKIFFPDVEFWRAEMIRAGLFIQGIPFQNVTDNHILSSVMKKNRMMIDRGGGDAPTQLPAAPFGQLPIIETYDGEILSQTQAIAAYVGKLGSVYNNSNNADKNKLSNEKNCCAGCDVVGDEIKESTDEVEKNKNIVLPVSLVEYRLYPRDNDIFAQAKCDEIINGCIDVTTTIGTTFKIEDSEEKEIVQKKLIETDGKLYRFFYGLNSIVYRYDNPDEKNGCCDEAKNVSYYCCGPKYGLTMADLAVYYLVKWFTSGTDLKNLKYVPSDFVVSNFLNLKRIYETVHNDQRIIQYMKRKQIALHACVQDFIKEKIDEQTRTTLGLYKKKITTQCMKKECLDAECS